MRKVVLVAVSAVSLGLALAPAVLADTITFTAFSDLSSDVMTGLTAAIPDLAGPAIAVGGGLFVLRLGWRLLHTFMG